MHQATKSDVPGSPDDPVDIDTHIEYLRSLDGKLAETLELGTCLKPEVALMLELYEADRVGRLMTVSGLGLLDGIPATTTLRYLELLQKKGVVKRVAHETDNRMTYVQITEAARVMIDAALKS